MLSTCSSADMLFKVADQTFVSDGINPTTGVIDVFLAFDSATSGGANPGVAGDQVLSWDIQTLDFTNLTGGITDVSETFTIGNLFDPANTKNLTTSGSSPYTLQGVASGGTTPTLDAGDTFFRINFSVPATETGTFDVVFNGVSQFGIFDELDDAYTNVGVMNGTIAISAVPEPSSFLLLGSIVGVILGVRKLAAIQQSKRDSEN